MAVNVGEAKTNLSKLIARAEAGEEVEIARDGVVVAKLVKAMPKQTAGEWWKSIEGIGSGTGWIGPDFEHSEEELDEIYDSPIFPE